tara:strand:- start:1301 stop:2281 length:981 start_codon:yes stop_codon:yes gene_type:complete
MLDNKINVLVTGGAGYIGSVLVDRLLNLNLVRKVYVLDNLFYKQESFFHFFKYFKSNKFEFVYGDVRDAKLLREYCGKVDVIIPLAAIVGFPACDKDKLLSSQINFDQVKQICEFASQDQFIIYPNTNSGYGVGESQETCTEETPLNPISHYGQTKCDAEKAVLDSQKGMSLRLATVFGCSPRMRIDLLVNDFVYKACIDKCIVLFEHHFRRNFVHVSDVAGAFTHFITENYLSHGVYTKQVFNVGLSSANFTKLQLCERIKEFLPHFVIKTAEFASDPDKRDYIVSNKKLENLGWEPQFSIDDGIQELISLYSAIKNINTNYTNL